MKAMAKLLALVLGLTAAGCLLQPQDADCAGATTCDACSDRSGCGWCNGTHTCVPGTSYGPTGGSCPAASWLFATCSGDDPNHCRDHSSCGSCGDAVGNCGWCVASNQCQPAGDPCTGTVITNRDTCGATICGALSGCASCVGNAQSCYWCTQSGRCAGSSSDCPHYEYVTSYLGMCR